MKIYLDLIFFLNFGFDFLLLMSVNLLLKRNKKITDILAGSILGGLSIFVLFFPMNSFFLFLFKIGISILMILVTFSYRDFKYTFRNFLYLYTTSMVLGGALYFLNVQFSYKQEGLIFYHNGLSINFIVVVLASPMIVYIYIKQGRHLRNHYQHYYQVLLRHGTKKIELCGFVDTGNHLVDPYRKKPILILDKRKFIYDINEFQMILVPIFTANGSSMMRCVKLDEVIIKNYGPVDVLIGLMDAKIPIDGVDCILSETMLEGKIC